MKKDTDATEYFARLSQQLNEEDLSRIDFDELAEHLRRFSTQRAATDELANEHAVLREDCQQRIAGMIKAIAAADRKRDSFENALTTIEEMSSLSAADLLRKYRQVSARFRDCFPTSFSGLRAGQGTSLRSSQLHEFK